jgi:choline dehydrogenase-like flavoprotein
MIRQELECDAVVVGAGPAGATAAAALAGSVSVVVLERKAVVEGKACAGGVLSRANKHLPPNALLRWQDDGVRVFTLTHRQRDGFSRDARRPLVRAVLRSEFDRTLIQWAEQQGARVLFGHRVSRIDVEDAQVRVTTDGLQDSAGWCGAWTGTWPWSCGSCLGTCGRSATTRRSTGTVPPVATPGCSPSWTTSQWGRSALEQTERPSPRAPATT